LIRDLENTKRLSRRGDASEFSRVSA